MKLPINHIKIVDNIEAAVIATRKTGDVAKGEQVYITMVTSSGKVAVRRLDKTGSEHWHDMEAFVWHKQPMKLTPSNDNGD